jgi:hypothetical protein
MDTPLRGVQLMDMERAYQIDSYYNDEPLIGACDTIKNDYVFRGGLSIEKMGRKETLTTQQQGDLKAFLSNAEQWRKKFNMCPVRRVTHEDGSFELVIPQLSSGKFAYRLDPLRLDVEIFFFLCAEFVPKDLREALGMRMVPGYYDLVYDPGIVVYVWPGGAPVLKRKPNGTFTAEFKTDVGKLFIEYGVVKELKDNMLSSDYGSSHPTIFERRKPIVENIDDMDEQEMLEGTIAEGSGKPSLAERRKYYRTAKAIEAAQKRVDAINSQNTNDVALRITVDPDTKQMREFSRRGGLWEGGHIEPLEEGVDVTPPVAFSSRTDILMQIEAYANLVCNIIGIPVSVVTPHPRYKADMAREQDMIRTTVNATRAAMSEFYRTVRRAFDYEKQTEELRQKWVELDAAEAKATRLLDVVRTTGGTGDSVPELAGQGTVIEGLSEELVTIRKKKKRTQKLLQKKERTELHFLEDPFLGALEMPQITAAAMQGCMTLLEEMNMYRTKLGLPRIEKESDIPPPREPRMIDPMATGGGAGPSATPKPSLGGKDGKPKAAKKKKKKKDGDGESKKRKKDADDDDKKKKAKKKKKEDDAPKDKETKKKKKGGDKKSTEKKKDKDKKGG